MSMLETIRHGDIVELRLARPPVNALHPELCRELREAVEAAPLAGAQALVLSGGPRVFSAGLDIPYLVGLGDDLQAVGDTWQAFLGAARALAHSPVPVAAAIDGHCPAGGCVLALCCDYRVMARGDYRIGLNETHVGLVPPEGIQRLMRRVVGRHRAERLLVGGRMVDSAEAERIGLVDELAAEGEAAARGLAWLQELLALPPQAMAQTRRIAREDLVEALQPEHIDFERFVQAWSDPATQAALRALVARLGK